MTDKVTVEEFNALMDEKNLILEEKNTALKKVEQLRKLNDANKDVSAEEVKDLREELTLAKREKRTAESSVQQLASALQENKDSSWFSRELEGEKRKTSKAEQELKAFKEKVAKADRERELNEADAKAIEDRRIAEIKASVNVSQNEHSRFRVLEKAPSGQRDVFGDPDTPVVDLGVEFSGYYGGLYLPVKVVIEVAQSIGMLTAEQSTELIHNVETSNARALAAPNLAKELQSGIDSLIGDFSNRLDSIVADVPVGESEPDTAKSAPAKSSGKAANAK